MRLSPATMASLPAEVSRFSYDREAQDVGIVHFGLGAFARAHLALYCDRAMEAGERDWMISGVSLRSDSVAQQLNPQGGLYTATQRSGDEAQTQLVGSVLEVLVADQNADRIVSRIAAPACSIVSFTVTEKGYCRAAAHGLDFDAARQSFYPLLTEGLKRRMDAGLSGVTLLSCDNLPNNGHVLGRLFALWLERECPQMTDWFATYCASPCTMVDRIVPATTDKDRDMLASTIGQRDEAAIFTERFSQWVIEDSFTGPHPRWENHGAELVADVSPYETAKLRMLNGAHSLLAYLGLELGHEFVHQAMADQRIRMLVKQLMIREAAGTIAAAQGQDLSAYAAKLIDRFDDPALAHRLAQIAMDGSQKIPQRWLETLGQSNGACLAVLTGVAAWLRHIAGGRHLDDPMAAQLQSAVASKTVRQQVEAIFGIGGVLAGRWEPSESSISYIEKAHAEIGEWGEE